MGSISSGLCYLQEVTELKVVWHPCPAATSCSPGLEWWLGVVAAGISRERQPGLGDISAALGKPVQPEEEMRAKERGSDLVFLPPFPD